MMKNKIRLIDINIVSSYMGRFLTAIVTVLVLAITISALMSEGGIRGHTALVLGLGPVGTIDETLDHYEPFRSLLASETGRKVEVHALEPEMPAPCELYVLPVRQFIEHGYDAGLAPLYSTCRMDGGRDSAVLISRPGLAPPDLSALTADDVIFAGPGSLNGFWLQLRVLESGGFAAPRNLDGLNFASVGNGGARVVFEVLVGDYVLGACRKSDLSELVEAGSVGDHEITVVRAVPALPEWIIACRVEDLDYYAGLLDGIATRLATPGRPPRNDDTAALLKARGVRSLRPVFSEELELAATLFAEMQDRISAGEN
jgi:hypothetical protein